GTANILSKPEFSFEDLRQLLRTFEEKTRLVKILNECIARDTSNKDVKIVIGSENLVPFMKNCALVTAPYRIGDGATTGVLSVLGPTRIQYARMIAVVSYVARMLEKSMSKQN
ncbi:MAG: HrcA family transcriptional regulator, partial [Pyrinomonadaceae bacterium]